VRRLKIENPKHFDAKLRLAVPAPPRSVIPSETEGDNQLVILLAKVKIKDEEKIEILEVNIWVYFVCEKLPLYGF